MTAIVVAVILCGTWVFTLMELRLESLAWRTWLDRQPEGLKDPPEIPNDLRALVNQETEVWAQEDTEKAMRERYAKTKDWNDVRRAFGTGVV